ncbi:hypothetical protein PYCCODRAFT_1474430 [Trametes coccinea BRFM310]|uniref:CLASP N-terminal domain-containing protein n=1 Tax=Trametes coccinea (strain BRFM310) TaxID=1353009 RepID=A0A1Y2J0Z2_TRAC3|nr:hypothetical protein PYCCODRAFT_1474430 [Trametes coccinea BRFM310]
MPAKAPLTIIECTSLSHLREELASVQDALSCAETEETWDAISRALIRFAALCNGNASTYPADLVAALRASSRPITSALNSERTRLSGTATESISTSVNALGRAFEPLIPHYLPTLLTLCSRTNKVMVTRAKGCIHAIIEHTQSPSIIHYLAESTKDKSVSLRLAAAEAVVLCLNSFNPPDLEKEQRAKEIEAIIRVTAVDASADIRKVGRKIFDAYKILLPGRVQSFTDPLTPTIRKYLDIKNTVATRSQPPSRPTSSQSARSGHSDLNASSSSRTNPTSATTTTVPSAAVRPTKHTRTVSTSSSAPKRPTRTPTPEVGVPAAPALDPPRRVREEPKRVGLAKLDMPPPDYIPTRSADSGPQRPLSATDLYFPHHANERPTSGPQRVALADAAASSSGTATNAVRSGPIRPVMLAMKPTQSVGEEPGEKKVTGGARRVLRLPDATEAASATADGKEKPAPSKPIRPRVISTSKSTPAVPLQAASAAAKEREDALRRTKLASSQGSSVRHAAASSAAASSATTATTAATTNARHARVASGKLHMMTASARARAAEKAQEKEKAQSAKPRAVSSSKAAVPPRVAPAATVTVRDRTRAVSSSKSSAAAKPAVKENREKRPTGTRSATSRAGTQEPPSRAQSVAPVDVPLPESPKATAQPVLPQEEHVQVEEVRVFTAPAPAPAPEEDLIDLRSTALDPADVPLPPSGSASPWEVASPDPAVPQESSPVHTPELEAEAPESSPADEQAEPDPSPDTAIPCEAFLATPDSEKPAPASSTISPLPTSVPAEEAHTPEQQRTRRAIVEQTPISALVASIERGFLSMRGVPLSPMREEAEEESSILVAVDEDADPDAKVFDDPEPAVQPLFLRRSRSVSQHV